MHTGLMKTDKKIFRSGCIVLCFTAVLILFSLTVTRLAFASSGAGGAEEESRIKCYRSVMVYLGDTLESMAEDNISPEYASTGALISDIMRINHLTGESKLIPGNYIIIPYFISEKDGLQETKL